MKSLVEQSSIVFIGTVRARALKPTTATDLPIVEKAGLVRVDSALEAPAVLGNLKGAEVIVRWRESEPTKVGGKAIFLTNALSYGERLALMEVGRLAAREQKAVEAALEERRQRPLRTRVEQAELIVIGVVDEVRPPEHPPASFDDPMWATALIRSSSTLKGRLSDDRVKVLFASSEDVRWYASPKLHPEQEGTFLIRRGEVEEAPRDAYTILGPLDVQPRGAASQFGKWLPSSGVKR